jgi:hypothetical protein
LSQISAGASSTPSRTSGVRKTAPAMRPAAARTSSRLTSGGAMLAMRARRLS